MRDLLELLDQAGEPVGAVVERVVARQQLARLGKEHHHEPHDHPDGGAVNVGRRNARGLFGQQLAVRLHEQLDRLADALAEHRGKLRLALARIEDRTLERRGGSGLGGRPESGLQQRAERLELGRRAAFFEEKLGIGLGERVEIEAGEDEPPLASVGEQRQALPARAEPVHHLARALAPAPDTDALLGVDEDRQLRLVGAQPQVARLDDLAGDRAASVLGAHGRGAEPLAACVRVKAAHGLKDERDELARFRAVIEEGCEALAEFALGVA